MKTTMSFPNFDAELDTDVCDAYNNADLTLTLKLGFQQINPSGGAATGTHHDYGDPADPTRNIVRWSAGAWSSWKANFVASAQRFWTGKFWLVNDSGLFHYQALGQTFIPNVYCKLKIVGSDSVAGNHHNISVVRLASSETWFGSHSTLYDSLDTNSVEKARDSAGNAIMQRAHVHEVGHLLGLDHVDVGQAHCPASGDTNASACYGVSDASLNSVMGSGMTIRLENAAPWRNAMRGFALGHVLGGGTQAANLTLMPFSRLFSFPTHLLASWPARLNRHYPRTIPEAQAGMNITSRVTRAAA
ncbi:MAG: hypothetical protein ACRC14_01335 [Paracoccaceae bacterium]